jgi:hypothetical protein
MKYLFVITVTIISTHYKPVTFKTESTLLAIQRVQDTTTHEVITTDTAEVGKYLREYPTAKVDTFILTPIKH